MSTADAASTGATEIRSLSVLPARREDVELVRAALASQVSRRELEAVGQALQRLELALTTFPRST